MAGMKMNANSVPSIVTSPPAPLQRGEGSKPALVSVPLRGKLSSGVTAFQYVDDYKKRQARALRKESTIAEQALWQRLRNRQVSGLKFRRQQVIEGFIADFYCESAKLVVEIDGTVHDKKTQLELDAYRERVFANRGLYAIRFRNEDVLNRIEWCLDHITEISQKRSGM